MASIWKLGTADIYVSEYGAEGDVKLSKHTVLDATGTSVLHYFGSGAEEVSLEALVFTEATKTTLESYRDNGTSVALTSDLGAEGNYKISSMDFTRQNVSKVIVPGIAETATVYRTRINLIKE